MFRGVFCHSVVQSNLFELLTIFNIVFPFMPSLNCISKVLGLVHKRSFDKFQRRTIRNIIFKNAYIDKYKGEIISRVSRLDVLCLLNCEGFNVSLIPDVEKGEVLIDSRGKGSLQNAK